MLEPVRWITRDGNILDQYAPTTPLLPGKLRLIDQTKLPAELVYLETDQLEEIFDCIRRLVVRGAPAIGCAAALGLAAVSQHSPAADRTAFLREVRQSAERLAQSRPTAVNLFWALNRCQTHLAASSAGAVPELKQLLVREALAILAEDIRMCRQIGEAGAPLLKGGMGVLTHCNAGALATGDYGTALAPIYVAHEKGLKLTVYSDETRPLLQGSRLTAWELQRAGIQVTVICDNMAGFLMKQGKIQAVITGADRIAANGDTANKIGTYSVSVLARHHGIPFYIAAPSSTFDLTLSSGAQIPIEQRNASEVTWIGGTHLTPENVGVYNPAFDVTPAEHIAAIITERGVIHKPDRSVVLAHLKSPGTP